jgi:adenylate cyclase
MATEIERRFLVDSSDPDFFWKLLDDNTRISDIMQGYLNLDPEKTVRVRVAGQLGFITVKGKKSESSGLEFEYAIPVEDAIEMLKLCGDSVIDKTRFYYQYRGHTWEIDKYHGKLDGLIIAEIELSDAKETFCRPVWIREEITNDHKYSNSSLAMKIV